MIKKEDLNGLYYEFTGSINGIVFDYMDDNGIEDPWDLMDNIQEYFSDRLQKVFDELEKKIYTK